VETSSGSWARSGRERTAAPADGRRMSRRLRRLALAALALWLPAPICAQGAVRAVHLVADLTAGDGAARVRVEVALDSVVPGAAVDATALEFAGARVEGVRAGREGEALATSRPRSLAGKVRLPVVAAPDARGGEVVAAYTVPGAVREDGPRVRVHVPVLGVDLPPEAASPGLFHAELRLPPGWRVAEGFPTGLRAADEPGVWTVDLAVVPAVLSLRARADGRWRPGVPALLDAVAVLLIGAFSVIGWRHLVRSA